MPPPRCSRGTRPVLAPRASRFAQRASRQRRPADRRPIASTAPTRPCLLGPVDVLVRDDHRAPSPAEDARRFEPDASSRAGDQADSILQAEIHRLGSLICMTTLLPFDTARPTGTRRALARRVRHEPQRPGSRTGACLWPIQLDGDIDVVYSERPGARARDRRHRRREAGPRGASRREVARARLRLWEGLTTPEIEDRFADSHRRWRSGEAPGPTMPSTSGLLRPA